MYYIVCTTDGSEYKWHVSGSVQASDGVSGSVQASDGQLETWETLGPDISKEPRRTPFKF